MVNRVKRHVAAVQNIRDKLVNGCIYTLSVQITSNVFVHAVVELYYLQLVCLIRWN